jgi:hypothetical protein
MSYLPAANISTITVNLGTVYGVTMGAGSAAMVTAGAFLATDVGMTATVIGAGPNTGDPFDGSLLKSTIASYTDSSHASLAASATLAVTPNNNLTIYRPILTTGRSYVVQNPGISINGSLTQKKTASFTTFSENGSLLPLRGQPVWIHDTNPDSTLDPFGGYIDKVKYKVEPGTGAVWATCDCLDWSGVFTRRLVGSYNSTYSALTLQNLVKGIVYGHGGSEGFVVDSVVGPSGLSASYDYSSSVAAALDDACSRAYGSGNSFYWFVDPWKIVKVVRQDTNTAAWTDLGNCLIEIEQDVTGEKKSNRVYASGSELVASVTENLQGNASSRTFNTSAPIGAAPTIVLNPGAHAQTVGALNVDPDPGFNWYWTQGSSELKQQSTDTTLNNTQSLAVTYQGIKSVQGWAAYNTGIDAAAAIEGGTGFYDLNLNLSAVGVAGSVQAIADQESQTNAANPSQVTLKSYRGGLHTADAFALVYAPLGINATYLIDNVSMETQDTLALWTYHLVLGPLLGDWRDPFVSLVGGTSQIGGGGSAAVPQGTPSGLTYTPALVTYGYFTLQNVAVSAPIDIISIDWYLVVLDELATDRFVTSGTTINNSTDPATIAVTESVTGAGSDFTIGDWVMFDDPGAYEWGQITNVISTGAGTYNFTIKRAYPGVPAGEATFGSLLNAHASGVTLFRGATKRFILGAQTGGGYTSQVPTEFPIGIPAVCVGAVVAAPVGTGGYGPWVVYNCATATIPGIRTLVGGEFSFQLSGALTASAGTNRAVPFQVPSDSPIRVDDCYVTTAPTGASIKVNVRRSSDGGTTWTTLEQLVIAIAAKTSWSTTPLDPPENRQAPYTGAWPFPFLRGGDLLNYTIEQVGSTVAGSDLTVKIDT